MFVLLSCFVLGILAQCAPGDYSTNGYCTQGNCPLNQCYDPTGACVPVDPLTYIVNANDYCTPCALGSDPLTACIPCDALQVGIAPHGTGPRCTACSRAGCTVCNNGVITPDGGCTSCEIAFPGCTNGNCTSAGCITCGPGYTLQLDGTCLSISPAFSIFNLGLFVVNTPYPVYVDLTLNLRYVVIINNGAGATTTTTATTTTAAHVTTKSSSIFVPPSAGIVQILIESSGFEFLKKRSLLPDADCYILCNPTDAFNLDFECRALTQVCAHVAVDFVAQAQDCSSALFTGPLARFSCTGSVPPFQAVYHGDCLSGQKWDSVSMSCTGCSAFTFPDCATECGLDYCASVNACDMIEPGCTSCNTTFCLSCQPGYAITPFGDCIPCDASCATCGTASCTSCVSPTAFIDASRVCVECSAGVGCLNCSADGLTCSNCARGTYLASNETCVQCLAECSTCSSGSVCTDCNQGYKLAGNSCVSTTATTTTTKVKTTTPKKTTTKTPKKTTTTKPTTTMKQTTRATTTKGKTPDKSTKPGKSSGKAAADTLVTAAPTSTTTYVVAISASVGGVAVVAFVTYMYRRRSRSATVDPGLTLSAHELINTNI